MSSKEPKKEIDISMDISNIIMKKYKRVIMFKNQPKALFAQPKEKPKTPVHIIPPKKNISSRISIITEKDNSIIEKDAKSQGQ